MTDLTTVKIKINEIPLLIKSEEEKLLGIEQNLLLVRQLKREIEMRVSYEVSIALDEVGKKLYPNESARESASHDRLSGMPEYRQHLEDERVNDAKKVVTLIEIDYQKREFKAIEYLLKALDLERGL